MDMVDIKKQYIDLSYELKRALSTMERSDRVFAIRDEIKGLQKLCPHNNGNYDFSESNECPYCGKKFRE